MLGGARLAFQDGAPQGAPSCIFVPTISTGPSTRFGRSAQPLDACAFGILQRQLELARQRIHGRSRPLPHALALEPHVPDSTAPGRYNAADGAVIGAVGVL